MKWPLFPKPVYLRKRNLINKLLFRKVLCLKSQVHQIPPSLPPFGKLRMVSLSNHLQREELPLFGKEGPFDSAHGGDFLNNVPCQLLTP